MDIKEIQDISNLRDRIQDSNINFVIGSGISRPYLPTLGNIENLLTQLEQESINKDKYKIIKVSLYHKYFKEMISKNINILENDGDASSVLENYILFFTTLKNILLKRKSTIIDKQINIFTTNIDIFMEKALEETKIEHNDGFCGRLRPILDLSNYNKCYRKKSLHFENISEIPVVNLFKVHGSATWELDDDEKIIYTKNLDVLRIIKEKEIEDDKIVAVLDSDNLKNLIDKAEGMTANSVLDEFINEYEKLLIINPTKEKLKNTLLDQKYYELLRIFSNELEKANTLLFVMGFSFADEHIREIVLRAANSNPTLVVYIFAYSSDAKDEIRSNFEKDAFSIKNNNVNIVTPSQKKGKDEYNYDLQNINNKHFSVIV